MLSCQFTIRESADPDEFRKAIEAVLAEALKAGPTRVGKVTGFRLLVGNRVGSERTYQLEIEGMLVLPPGLREAIEFAGAEEITSNEYVEVLSSSSET